MPRIALSCVTRPPRHVSQQSSSSFSKRHNCIGQCGTRNRAMLLLELSPNMDLLFTIFEWCLLVLPCVRLASFYIDIDLIVMIVQRGRLVIALRVNQLSIHIRAIQGSTTIFKKTHPNSPSLAQKNTVGYRPPTRKVPGSTLAPSEMQRSVGLHPGDLAAVPPGT